MLRARDAVSSHNNNVENSFPSSVQSDRGGNKKPQAKSLG